MLYLTPLGAVLRRYMLGCYRLETKSMFAAMQQKAVATCRGARVGRATRYFKKFPF
jgi:hypothetical protein